ncbi:KpsF/GutQ family sugar-phosphate isomerase [Yoonia sediminilitoris]|uniref:Arabinose-5-phosphate isomerase n=1 Tax=Yoonia sediminilitoris TaxID=1286148 RepID=A0A2T6KLL0_9RHOB|nr:KpsF/GutQ family sugar-phosphate isomerase [Yoonia sediminilitoris]PUB17108.1 arabinose-5-phosphate isomerase [Yoonia sediminilitoris]RCW97403.1 arabinose-5-phosphate isomerase [Yoonia sediminilitoris]
MAHHPTFLAAGKRVIETESAALATLSSGLDDSFGNAIDLLLHTKGRVIVSGMGKSGHIARKIAATFASTGTPAHFVHPAEASHGDLGMITQADVVIAISNSGEVPELANLISYTRRFAIPLIGITSVGSSSLATRADIALLLPQLGEACGKGIVPTTSTTMTLAMGDALAVALMEHRDFSPENFREFHPGGQLGARLSKVADLMHVGDSVPLIQEDASMGDTLLVISQKGFGVVGVLDADEKLIGVITDGDLRRNMDGLLDMTAGQVMTREPKTIRPDLLAEEAVAAMSGQVTCLFVTDHETDATARGILHIHDCLRAGVI